MTYEQRRGKKENQNNIRFKSGQFVKQTSKETYLGGQVRVLYNTGYEIGRRIAVGEGAYKDMKRILLNRK